MKRRNELNMKPVAVIHMLSPRNFKIGSYTRSPHVGGLATVSRHPAVVHAGGVSIYIYIYIFFNTHIDKLSALVSNRGNSEGRIGIVAPVQGWAMLFQEQ